MRDWCRHRHPEHEGGARRPRRRDPRAACGGVPAGHAQAAVGRAVAARVVRRGARMHRAGERRRARGGHRRRVDRGALREQPVRRLGHSGRPRDAAAASVPHLDGPARDRRGRLGARARRRRTAWRDHGQRRRQLLRLHEDAVAAREAPRRVGERALLRAAERVRRVSADGRARGRSQRGGQHRRRLRSGPPRLVRRGARHAGHSGDDDAGAARRFGRGGGRAAARMGARARPRGGHARRRGRRRRGRRDVRGGCDAARPARRDDRHEHVLGLPCRDGRRAARARQHAARVRRPARPVRVRRRDHGGRVGIVVSRAVLPRGNRGRARGRRRCASPARGRRRRGQRGQRRRAVPAVPDGRAQPGVGREGERRVRRPVAISHARASVPRGARRARVCAQAQHRGGRGRRARARCAARRGRRRRAFGSVDAEHRRHHRLPGVDDRRGGRGGDGRGAARVSREAARRGWVTLAERARPDARHAALHDARFALYAGLYPALQPFMHGLQTS